MNHQSYSLVNIHSNAYICSLKICTRIFLTELFITAKNEINQISINNRMDKKEIRYILMRIQYSKNRGKSQNIILSKRSQSKQAKLLHAVKVGTVVNLGQVEGAG